MTVAAVRSLFAELRAGLRPLIDAIRARPQLDDSCLTGDFAEPTQRAFGEKIVRSFGYDFARGRQDKTAHPFMIKLGRGDVRITTRYRGDDLSDGLFSRCTRLAMPCTNRVSTTRSTVRRFSAARRPGSRKPVAAMENLVGRSRAFWSHWFAPLRLRFPKLRASTSTPSIAPSTRCLSLVRTDADGHTTCT
jgi:carboxypeptidase Taq